MRVAGGVSAVSAAKVCDNCGVTIQLNARGEADDGDDAAWLRLHAANESFDLCTRSCVVEFLERPGFVEAMDAWTETITGIARTIRGDDD